MPPSEDTEVQVFNAGPAWTWVPCAYFGLSFVLVVVFVYGLIWQIGPAYGLPPCGFVLMLLALPLVFQLPVSRAEADRRLVLDFRQRKIIAEGLQRWHGSRAVRPPITARFDEVSRIDYGRILSVDFVVIRGRDMHGLPMRISVDSDLRPYGELLQIMRRTFGDRLRVPWYARLPGSRRDLAGRDYPEWRRSLDEEDEGEHEQPDRHAEAEQPLR